MLLAPLPQLETEPTVTPGVAYGNIRTALSSHDYTNGPAASQHRPRFPAAIGRQSLPCDLSPLPLALTTCSAAGFTGGPRLGSEFPCTTGYPTFSAPAAQLRQLPTEMQVSRKSQYFIYHSVPTTRSPYSAPYHLNTEIGGEADYAAQAPPPPTRPASRSAAPPLRPNQVISATCKNMAESLPRFCHDSLA